MARTPVRPRPKKPSAAAQNPNTRSLEWQSMQPKWWLMNTLLGGTAAMREAGTAVLPQHQGESVKNYQDRSSEAILTNFVRLTLEFLVGKPFAQPVVFREGTPEALTLLASDIDGQGNDLTTVCMDFFDKGLSKGWSWLMVEYPTVLDPDNVTLKDMVDKNLRPFWCVIPADNVIAARGMKLEGKWAWTHVRIFTSDLEDDGFDQVLVNRIKMYELVDVNPDANRSADYRVRITTFKEKDTGADKWEVEVASSITSAKRIPLVRFQAKPDASMPFEDLCYQNVKHYQSSADQSSAITMARFPILAGSGIDEEKTFKVGSYELLTTSDPQAKFYYVENNGTAIAVGSGDIGALEDHMAMYGAQMLKKRPGRETASARIIDEVQNMAPLQIMVLQFMSCMEVVVDFTLQWMELPEATDNKTYGVDVNLDFAMSQENQKIMEFYENARLQGDVSRPQFYAVAKELGFCPDSFNPTSNETELKAERQEAQDFALETAQAKGTQGATGSGTGSPVNNPNQPKIKRQTAPAV